MESVQPSRIVLLLADTTPAIAGWCEDDSGRRHAFHGWPELAALLEHLHGVHRQAAIGAQD